MTQSIWPNCPSAIHDQVSQFTDSTANLLGSNLVGLYLHGSLAMCGFNPARSDIDLLIVTDDPITAETARGLAEISLNISGQPRPLELSSLPMTALHPWQYPTPFDFHFSEGWREKLSEELADGRWQGWPKAGRTDPDLAAHITIINHRGICLIGQPISEVFPNVPRADYLDSILADFQFARDGLAENPVYAVLNFCRIYIYVLENRITSKDEAGEWALAHLPEYAPLIQSALAVYRGEADSAEFDIGMLTQFTDEMWQRINNILTNAT